MREGAVWGSSFGFEVCLGRKDVFSGSSSPSESDLYHRGSDASMCLIKRDALEIMFSK